MEPRRDTIARRARFGAAAVLGAFALTAVMTWPLAGNMGGLGRSTGGGDGLYSIWNVAWVAHALTTRPADLFNANIFYPHRHSLAYSEANIGAGLVSIPAWLLTGNAYAAHNLAVLTGFATALLGMWLLARELTGHAAAAVVAGIAFAFWPYMMTHTAHIQLLMAGGIPVAMLVMHRVADRPSLGRGVLLGLVLAAQALSCAYYGIFAGLTVGYAAAFLATTRGLWKNRAYWTAVLAGAVISIGIVLPFFLPYLIVQDQGFTRTLQESARYSANAQSYIASPAHAHNWMLALTPGWPRWIEALFPGFMAIVLGGIGIILVWRRGVDPGGRVARDRETVLLYGSLGLLAFWASFGPVAGLYSLLFRIPVFSFLRAPSRLGVIVQMSLAVVCAIALRRLLASQRPARQTAIALAVAALAAIEFNVLPFPWERAQRISPMYDVLARMPRGPVAEFPYYAPRAVFHLHTQYMLFSTRHWMPLVNGYSDHIPLDFREASDVLHGFPSQDAFRVLQRYRVRYIGVHWDMLGPRAGDVRKRLAGYSGHLRPLGADDTMSLYEILSFP